MLLKVVELTTTTLFSDEATKILAIHSERPFGR